MRELHCRAPRGDVPFNMHAGHRSWIDLLNAQEGWLTDAQMLTVIPEESRDFESGPNWPLPKALAYLHNNASALRVNYQRLEAGELLDVDLLNPVLDTITMKFVDWRRKRSDWRDLAAERRRQGDRLAFFAPAPQTDGWNRGSTAIRHLIQRATFHFCRYADLRLSDPAYPGATSGMFRVLGCPAAGCASLVACPVGWPAHCSETCAEDTGRLEG